jgi:glycosyltransferase involved in cell wall biosynthesis
MNKGFARSKGEVVVYLNADDYFFPGAFSAVAPEFEKGAKFVVGNVLIKSERLGAEFINTPRITLEGMMRHWEPNAFCHNPVGYFYRREVQEICPFNTGNYSTMDLEFLLDAASRFPFVKVEHTLGCYMDSLNTKTHITQIKEDYWRPATFPYVDAYLVRLAPEERQSFLADREVGYAACQAEFNYRRKLEQEQIGHPGRPASKPESLTFLCQSMRKSFKNISNRLHEYFFRSDRGKI